VTIVLGQKMRQYQNQEGVILTLPTTTGKIVIQDLTAVPARGDSVVIGTTTYRVQEVTINAGRSVYDLDLMEE
jgi:hypothetical protein